MKYFLRGLATGLVVAAVLMALVGRKSALTDEEIMARAAKLGMVKKDTTLVNAGTDISNQKETPSSDKDDQDHQNDPEGQDNQNHQDIADGIKDTNIPEKEPEAGSETAPEKEPEAGSETDPEKEPEAGSETDPEKEPEAGSEPAPEQTSATIQIFKGNSSYTVAKALQAAGLVEDAKAYDEFLCNNKYDKSLSVGIYEIPFGTSQEDIAKIITRRK